MNKRYIFNLLIMFLFIIGMIACDDDKIEQPIHEEEVVTPPEDKEEDKKDKDDDKEENPEEEVDALLPDPMEAEIYSPSNNQTMYRPIMVDYSPKDPPNVRWEPAVKTRILPYIIDFTANNSTERYQSITNKYGSRIDKPQHTATGRFYTKKIDGRWWIIDPEGYIHYHRGINSVRKGTSVRNESAWNIRFGSNEQWMKKTQEELASIGFHGTGAFGKEYYSVVQDYNRSNPHKPMTLCPSFGFMSGFRRHKNYDYPDDKSENAVGLVFYDGWEEFCDSYFQSELGPYMNDPNVIGFFSDNELNFSSYSSYILERFLRIKDDNNPAFKAAESFMLSKGKRVNPNDVTSQLNDEFSGIIAERYYKGVKDAVNKNDPGMMYFGTRLHGTPKYLKGVMEAAGRHCDVISINYYNRWDVELTTKVADWYTWADAPFMVTEFYTKAYDSELPNTSGAGLLVRTQQDRAYAYQHFTLGLLEAKNCVGWHWFKYQDDDGDEKDGDNCNKGLYDNYYKMYPYLGEYMKNLNYNVYDLIEFFDN